MFFLATILYRKKRYHVIVMKLKEVETGLTVKTTSALIGLRGVVVHPNLLKARTPGTLGVVG